jgi:membrane associated rhomboid family serine protease
VSERQPIFNAPGVVVAVLAAFVVMFLAVDPEHSLLPDETRAQLFDLLAFSPARLGHRAGDLAGGRVAEVTQFVTHVLVHGGLAHLIINSAWFLAFGTAVARRMGAVRFLAFFLVCGVGGALLFLPFNMFDAVSMVGASGAISGLMGAALRFLFQPLMTGDAEALAGDTRRAPLLSLPATLGDWRILAAIAVWTVLNILGAWAAPALLQEQSIAWEAHLGGFFTGLLTFGLFDPKPPVHDNSAPAT